MKVILNNHLEVLNLFGFGLYSFDFVDLFVGGAVDDFDNRRRDMAQNCFERYSSQLTIFDGKILVYSNLFPNLGSSRAVGSITAGLDIESFSNLVLDLWIRSSRVF